MNVKCKHCKLENWFDSKTTTVTHKAGCLMVREAYETGKHIEYKEDGTAVVRIK